MSILSNDQYDIVKSTIIPTFLKTNQFFADFTHSILHTFEEIPENDVLGSQSDKTELLVRCFQIINKFEAINLQVTQFQRQILISLEFEELKQIYVEVFKKFIDQLMVQTVEFYETEILVKYVHPSKNSKYLKLFHNLPDNLLSTVYHGFHEFVLELDHSKLPFTGSKSVSTLSINLLELLNLNLTNDVNFRDHSTLYLKYLAVCRVSHENELLEFHEYLLELKFTRLNYYSESNKRATKVFMNKNLLTLYKVTYLVCNLFDEQDDLIFWVSTKFYENIKQHKKNNVSIGENEDDGSDYGLESKLKQMIEVSKSISINNSEIYNNILGELLCNNPLTEVEDFKPDLKNRIKQLYNILALHNRYYPIYPKLLQSYTNFFKYSRDDSDGGVTEYLYSLYENQFGSFVNKLNSILEFLSGMGITFEEPGFEKLIKNDIKMMEFYREIKGLVKLGNVISANELKVKRAINSKDQ